MSGDQSEGDRGSIPLYFGCWDRVGHGFHRRDGRSADYDPDTGTPPTPWKWGVESLAPDTGRQGAALLHHRDGWTALAVDDYTVDDRGGSKSVFCFPAVLTFDDALDDAAENFPQIVERVGRITMEVSDE